MGSIFIDYSQKQESRSKIVKVSAGSIIFMNKLKFVVLLANGTDSYKLFF